MLQAALANGYVAKLAGINLALEVRLASVPAVGITDLLQRFGAVRVGAKKKNVAAPRCKGFVDASGRRLPEEPATKRRAVAPRT